MRFNEVKKWKPYLTFRGEKIMEGFCPECDERLIEVTYNRLVGGHWCPKCCQMKG